MGVAIVTVKIMPESPETDLGKLEEEAKAYIDEFTGKSAEKKVEIEPVAFGLKALKITFVMNEDLGSPDPVAEKIDTFEGVNSATISDVRRALG
jgi:elongation factor 1-beta